MALNVLPTSLVLQQLLMFVLKYWESGTEIDDIVALRDTFENLSTALLSSVKHKGIECWDQTVSGCLFLASNLIEVYLTNSRNKRIFVEIMRTIVKVVRIVFQRISENKRTNCSPSSSTQVISNDSVEDHGNVDVIYAIDGVSQSTEGIWNNEDTSPKCLKMVFGHPVFKDWFCVRVGQQKLEIQRAVDYVSSVVSNSVAELMRNLQKEILDDKDHEFWKPYFLQIAYEIKQEASKEQITGRSLFLEANAKKQSQKGLTRSSPCSACVFLISFCSLSAIFFHNRNLRFLYLVVN